MISMLISFFGGTAFRMLWGEISSFFTKRQDHQHEIERMRLQGELDAAQHARNLESIKVQADLKVQVIRVQGDADVERIGAEGWRARAEAVGRTTGIWWVDLWNGVITPGCATWALVMVTGNYCHWWALDDQGWSLCGGALGIYLGNRFLFKRGK